MLLSPEELNYLLKAQCGHPHQLLGMHPVGKGKGIVVRAWLQGAVTCACVDIEHPDIAYPMPMVAPEGLFELVLPSVQVVFPYYFKVTYADGTIRPIQDPYRFLPSLSDDDLYYFAEGNHHLIYQKLGSHIIEHQEVKGIRFAVWAPHAQRVSVVGDFNHWDGRYHPMRLLGASGVWELFIPGLPVGSQYKYELIGADHRLFLKTDPYAQAFEAAPHHASIVCSDKPYPWQDQNWMQQRGDIPWHQKPISIYEVHHGSWRAIVEDGNRPLSYREMAHALAEYVEKMGFTHVEFMPLAEHPFAGSWGYQVTGFFAPTHRFGSPEDFCYLVDTLHQKGIGVLIDWVGAHFPKDAFALARFDGTCLYEHADPRQGEHKDWGTLIFNYDRHEVRNFLIASVLSWFDRFHIDGMRVDAVASMLYLDYSKNGDDWVPNIYGGKENLGALHFIREMNQLVHHYYPGALMIAEESTSWSGVTRSVQHHGLGFDFKWNMGWMHDTLIYFQKDPIYRPWHHNQLTFGMLYQYSENFIQVFSHDEVVHGKGSLLNKMAAGNIPDKARSLRAMLAYQWCWPGKKGLFMGQEFGQSREWAYDQSLDWHLLQYDEHQGLQTLVKDLNHWYKSNPGLAAKDAHPEGFAWVQVDHARDSVLSFLRYGQYPADTVLVVCNFSHELRFNYRVGVPHTGYWVEKINTDATCYSGLGYGNWGGCSTQLHSSNGFHQSLSLTLPPMSVLIFQHQIDPVYLNMD